MRMYGVQPQGSARSDDRSYARRTACASIRCGERASQHLGQVGADQVASLVQVNGIPFRAIALRSDTHFAHVAAVAVLSDELGNAVAALACASRAFPL